MIQYIVGIEGMQCGMCEAHINETIRKAFPVKKVSSSHSQNRSVILTDTPIDEQKLRSVIHATGYTLTSFSSQPYEKKKGHFSFRK